MRRRFVAVVALAAAAFLAAGALALQQAGVVPDPAATSEARGTGSPSSTPGTESPASTPAPHLPDAQATTQPGESTESRATGPDAPAGTAPQPAPLPALVTLPLPDTSSATGSVVAGFPDRVLPAAPQSSIASSSITTEGSRLQAALVAETPLTVGEVLDFYTSALTALGLVGAPVPAPDGSSALAFTRGVNSVTLTANPVDGGSEYTVLGIFSAES
ncbi:hypothetical protein [Cryobacterium sp. PAMC25264]|uniref:hypothetical protein n=1 Tax=Cryobacterium sp. PAMC25264 TaxID=2861288 RepID=UPI001C635B0E|nr:hypothetical protein [Cryobacterium sp. PAMC25264]QYF72825.1 hypothetical protein KY500_13720 [Cryobacterium sp. PAMC25264]